MTQAPHPAAAAAAPTQAIAPAPIWTGAGMIDPARPDPDLIELDDIARGLAVMPRFAGHTDPTRGPYTVAWHSLLCERLAEADGLSPTERLTVLLHDAPEYVLCDIPSPVKRLLPDYQAVEARWWNAVAARFDLPDPLPDYVEPFDAFTCQAERAFLQPSRPDQPERAYPPQWTLTARIWFDQWAYQDARGDPVAAAVRLFVTRAEDLLAARG